MSTVDKDFADKIVAAKGVLFPETEHGWLLRPEDVEVAL